MSELSLYMDCIFFNNVIIKGEKREGIGVVALRLTLKKNLNLLNCKLGINFTEHTILLCSIYKNYNIPNNY